MGGKGSNCPPWLLLASVFLWVSSSFQGVTSSDADVLLKFKNTLTAAGNGNTTNNAAILQNWDPQTNPCDGKRTTNWAGVICTGDGKNVYGLQLENMSLSGKLDTGVLAGLSELRTLSFQNNGFVGPIPNLGRLGALRSVYLSRNKFSGEIPDDAFSGMGSLRKVFLSQNGFQGPIPTSLAKVSKLVELRLEENGFTGGLPDLRQPGLTLNVSYNDLEGPIPDSLSKMDATSFIGNKDLCGEPLGATCQSSSNGPPGKEASSTKNKKLSSPLLVAIIVIAVVALLGVLGAVFVLFCHRRGQEESQLGRPSSSKTKKVSSFEVDHLEKGSVARGGSGKKATGASKEHDHGRLVFVREDRERFELQDLLRASAEVLGSGSFGSSYKAVLLSGASMVVKRFKEMNGVGREEFQEHMRRLGRLSHPNLLPLVAYYYRKEEKLLVTDYIPNGSLAHLLHGNHGGSNPPKLDWVIRLKIVKGVARGLAYLQNELPMLTLFHGHLKSSNVLLSDNFEPLLTDHALVPVMNPSHATQVMAACKSPEYTQFSRTTKKTDVWSLGMLILEVLSGKYPASFIQQGQGGADLASWADSVVREEWTGDVFEGEVLKLLEIGLGCCEEDVGKRWELMEALEKIEELRERESDEECTHPEQ